jgi:hypothetical protein
VLEEEVVARRGARGGEGRIKNRRSHLLCLISLDPAQRVSFSTLYDNSRFCKWWFLGAYGWGLARSNDH